MISKSNTDFIGGEKNFPPIFFPKSRMINEDDPYKLKEIIMDTWPNLFWLKDIKKSSTDLKVNNNGSKYTTSTDEGVV